MGYRAYYTLPLVMFYWDDDHCWWVEYHILAMCYFRLLTSGLHTPLTQHTHPGMVWLNWLWESVEIYHDMQCLPKQCLVLLLCVCFCLYLWNIPIIIIYSTTLYNITSRIMFHLASYLATYSLYPARRAGYVYHYLCL